MDDAHAANRLDEGATHRRVELFLGGLQDLGGHAKVRGTHTVEALPQLPQSVGAVMAHLLTDRSHHLECGLDVELGARQRIAQATSVQGAER